MCCYSSVYQTFKDVKVGDWGEVRNKAESRVSERFCGLSEEDREQMWQQRGGCEEAVGGGDTSSSFRAQEAAGEEAAEHNVTPVQVFTSEMVRQDEIWERYDAVKHAMCGKKLDKMKHNFVQGFSS